jgi:hypothetical protein
LCWRPEALGYIVLSVDDGGMKVAYKEARKSIGHHRMTLQDILVSWKSHFQHGVSSKSAASVQANERPFCFPASVAPSEVVSI